MDSLPTSRKELRIAALVGSVAVLLLVVVPFWPSIVLALWIAGFIEPLRGRLTRILRHRSIACALLTLGVVLVVVVPLAFALVPLSLDAIELVRRTSTAGDTRTMLRAFVEDRGQSQAFDPSFDELLRSTTIQGTRAWPILRSIAGATGHAVAGVFVFLVVIYSRLDHGEAGFAWLRRYLPFDAKVLDRLAGVFDETGRGLFVGIGGSALVQAAVATIAYVIVGVPHPLVLGTLTFIAALIPGLGTALAWMPIAGGLAITGRPVAALAVLAVGLLLVGTIDNVAKPLLARYGQLRLPASVVFVAMLAGFVVIGPTGILLAPLVVRGAKELLLLHAERAPALTTRTPLAPDG